MTVFKNSWAFRAESLAKVTKSTVSLSWALSEMVRSTAQGTWFTRQAWAMAPPSISQAMAPNSFCSQSPSWGSATNLSPVATTPKWTRPYNLWASLASSCVKSRSQGSWITNPSTPGRDICPTGQLSRAEVSKSYSTQAVARTTSPIWTFSPMPPATPRFSTSLGLNRSIMAWAHRAAFTFPGEHWDTTTGTPDKVPVVNSMPPRVWACFSSMAERMASTSTFIAPIIPTICSTAQSSFTAFCRSFPR